MKYQRGSETHGETVSRPWMVGDGESAQDVLTEPASVGPRVSGTRVRKGGG